MVQGLVVILVQCHDDPFEELTRRNGNRVSAWQRLPVNTVIFGIVEIQQTIANGGSASPITIYEGSAQLQR